MELSSQDVEIPIPINSSYGGHMIHHHDPSLVVVVPHNHSHTQNQNLNNIINQASIPSSNGQSNAIAATNLSLDLDHHQDHDHDGVDIDHVVVPYTKKQVNSVIVRYRECLKNHAAAMGGAATDGCGEFMPSGEEGTIEALTCSACNCHRNFHRKEVEGEPLEKKWIRGSRKLILGHGHDHKNVLLGTLPPEAMPMGLGYPRGSGGGAPPPLPYHHHRMIIPSSYSIGGSHPHQVPSESDEGEDGSGGGPHLVGGTRTHIHGMNNKKRFRTKFSQEQKEKMMSFAEKVGWRIQKQEEGVVQQFCQEIGVKRRVLKVWMHNNKHSLAKKQQNLLNQNNPSSTTTTITTNVA